MTTLELLSDFGGLAWFWALFWVVVKMAAVTAVTTGLSMLLAKRNKSGMKPAGVTEFRYPTAIEGRPLPVVWGKRRVLSCNAITPAFDYTARKKKHKRQTAAYYYFAGLHLQVCHAADGVKQIWVAHKCLWPTVDDETAEAADATLTASITLASQIFGGWRREGGFSGTISIQYGGAAQAQNAYLTSKLGTDIPAYRGMVGLILERPYIGTSPYLKPVTALVKRTDIFCDPARSAMWYVAKANVGDDHMNPVHVIYELITSPYIGAGKDTALIGGSFTTAADSCYADGYGVDVVWDSAPDDVQSMIDKLCEIIDGVVYQDPSTGLFEIALARPDYDPGALTAYDESDFWVEDYEVPSPAKTPAKTVVHWHDRVSTKKRQALDDDIALLEIQGANPVIREHDFSGFIAWEELANKVAAREQNQASAMSKILTLRADRRMSDLNRGDVFKITYGPFKIVTMIVRVIALEYGSLADGEVTLRVQEDVYGTIYTVYGSPPLETDAEGVTDPVTDIDYYGNTTSGTVTWDDGFVHYEGRTYAITGDAAGTTDQYVYFDPSVSETELQHSAAPPTGGTAYVLFENSGGVITETYAMVEETTVVQADYITDDWRFRQDADRILHIERETGGAWNEDGGQIGHASP